MFGSVESRAVAWNALLQHDTYTPRELRPINRGVTDMEVGLALGYKRAYGGFRWVWRSPEYDIGPWSSTVVFSSPGALFSVECCVHAQGSTSTNGYGGVTWIANAENRSETCEYGLTGREYEEVANSDRPSTADVVVGDGRGSWP